MSDTIIQQWNQAAQSFTDGQECSAFAELNKTFVKQRFRKLNGEKVLDLGCGYGWYTDYFSRIGGNVVGIDGAEAMLDIARNRSPAGSFFLAGYYPAASVFLRFVRYRFLQSGFDGYRKH